MTCCVVNEYSKMWSGYFACPINTVGGREAEHTETARPKGMYCPTVQPATAKWVHTVMIVYKHKYTLKRDASGWSIGGFLCI